MSQGYASAGFPPDTAFQPWTATLANMTKGDGTIVSRFAYNGVAGGLVVARFKFTLGSTSTIGTKPSVSAPVVAASSGLNDPHLGPAVLHEDGSSLRFGVAYLDTTTTILSFAQDASGTHLAAANVTATVPFTWGENDIYSFLAIYEAA